MNRKHFLGSAMTLLAASAVSGKSVIESASNREEDERFCILPPYLKEGDIIGITSPAGSISLEDIQPAIQKLQSWGYKIKIGNTIGKKDFTFGGTDEERRNDFQEMLDDDSVNAILCARGGYGVVRIIDKLDFKKFKNQPKWIIGFSDITVLHNHINTNLRIATLHSKMCNSFPKDWSAADATQLLSLESIDTALKGEYFKYSASTNKNNKPGSIDGELVGGNLRIIETLSGTSSDLNTKNKILFLEDTEEYLYNIDRMFWNLKRTGKLDHLKGLIIGGFKIKPDDPGEEFGLTLEQIVLEKVKEYNYPVCFNFPVGHQFYNIALKCGMIHRLNVWPDVVSLTQG
jgi:muramoyltetrapeptide carboxypeptidase